MIRHSILKLHLLFGAMSAFSCLPAQAAPPRLLPFQGRLTDASGTPVADGAKVVQFKIYDAPTGGTAVWNGEVQKLTVNGGLVSTLLGSKASLEPVDFNEALYLEITVDANADNQITAADPPLLPRQSILPAVFAVEAQRARTLDWVDGNGVVQGSANWSVLFGSNNDPATASIPASKISFPAGSLPPTVLPPESLTSAQIGPNAVETSELKDGAVKSEKIGPGEVKTINLAGTAAGGVETVPGAVTSEKIKDGTIATIDVADHAITPQKLARQFAYFVEEKLATQTANGVTGWNTRQLNKEEFQIGTFASLGANGAITLQPGKYLVEGTASATGSNAGMIILRKVATDSVAIVGSESSARYILVSYIIDAQNKGLLKGLLTVGPGPETFDLQQYVGQPAYAQVLGAGAGGTSAGVKGQKWIASSVFIEKLE